MAGKWLRNAGESIMAVRLEGSSPQYEAVGDDGKRVRDGCGEDRLVGAGEGPLTPKFDTATRPFLKIDMQHRAYRHGQKK